MFFTSLVATYMFVFIEDVSVYSIAERYVAAAGMLAAPCSVTKPILHRSAYFTSVCLNPSVR